MKIIVIGLPHTKTLDPCREDAFTTCAYTIIPASPSSFEKNVQRGPGRDDDLDVELSPGASAPRAGSPTEFMSGHVSSPYHPGKRS